MKYIASSKSFTITEKELQHASYCLLWAIKHIRIIAKLPLDKYKKEHVGLTDADFAQKGILDAANAMGIDLGAEWGEQLDVRGIG